MVPKTWLVLKHALKYRKCFIFLGQCQHSFLHLKCLLRCSGLPQPIKKKISTCFYLKSRILIWDSMSCDSYWNFHMCMQLARWLQNMRFGKILVSLIWKKMSVDDSSGCIWFERELQKLFAVPTWNICSFLNGRRGRIFCNDHSCSCQLCHPIKAIPFAQKFV